MRVVHLSTKDRVGGAGRATYRLHSGLLRLGCDSAMVTARMSAADSDVRTASLPSGLLGRARRRLARDRRRRTLARYERSRPAGYEPFSDERGDHGTALVDQLRQADLVHLHWIARFVDYPGFFQSLPSSLPIVWTLHDMNPFTGGCHYDDECGRSVEECGSCPQLGSRDPRDLSHRIWESKVRALSNVADSRLHVVGVSSWIAQEAKKSSLLGRFPVTVIPNGLDTDEFAPRDAAAARDALGIPGNANVIMFAAATVHVRRKGLRILEEALRRLPESLSPLLITVGAGSWGTDRGIPAIDLGHIGDNRLLSLIYSAADMFVAPSLQEAFGQTVVEAMACGTPVVAFDAGGISDIVRHGVTGDLVPVGDVSALSAGIQELLRDRVRRETYSRDARQTVVANFSMETQAKRYMELYGEVLGTPGRSNQSLAAAQAGNVA